MGTKDPRKQTHEKCDKMIILLKIFLPGLHIALVFLHERIKQRQLAVSIIIKMIKIEFGLKRSKAESVRLQQADRQVGRNSTHYPLAFPTSRAKNRKQSWEFLEILVVMHFLSPGLGQINRQAFKHIFKGSHTSAFPSLPRWQVRKYKREGRPLHSSLLHPLHAPHSSVLTQLVCKGSLGGTALLDVQSSLNPSCCYVGFLGLIRFSGSPSFVWPSVSLLILMYFSSQLFWCLSSTFFSVTVPSLPPPSSCNFPPYQLFRYLFHLL